MDSFSRVKIFRLKNSISKWLSANDRIKIMCKEVLKTEDLHIEYPPTDGKVVGFPDPLLGTRYVWRETKPLATTKVQQSQYILLRSNPAAKSEDKISE